MARRPFLRNFWTGRTICRNPHSERKAMLHLLAGILRLFGINIFVPNNLT